MLDKKPIQNSKYSKSIPVWMQSEFQNQDKTSTPPNHQSETSKLDTQPINLNSNVDKNITNNTKAVHEQALNSENKTSFWMDPNTKPIIIQFPSNSQNQLGNQAKNINQSVNPKFSPPADNSDNETLTHQRNHIFHQDYEETSLKVESMINSHTPEHEFSSLPEWLQSLISHSNGHKE